MRDSVTVSMAAPIDDVWDLVSDVTRIGEFSPETVAAEWLGGATGPAVGAKFRGQVHRNQRGPKYWTTCTVSVSDAPVDGRAEFAFDVGTSKMTVITWGYTLAATDSGTDVTEYFSLANSGFTRLYWKLLGRLRGRTNRRNMTETLERMRAVVEG